MLNLGKEAPEERRTHGEAGQNLANHERPMESRDEAAKQLAEKDYGRKRRQQVNEHVTRLQAFAENLVDSGPVAGFEE